MIAQGHNPAEVMNYTPRQMAAFIAIGAHRKRGEMRDQLQMAALAARGEPKALKEAVKELDQ